MPFGRKPPDRYQDATEYLCQNVADLRTEIGADLWDVMVRALLAAKPGSPQWRDAITAVHEAAIAAGIPTGIGLGATMGGGFPALPPGPATGWTCPAGRCSRVVLREGDMATPLCALAGESMRLVE